MTFPVNQDASLPCSPSSWTLALIGFEPASARYFESVISLGAGIEFGNWRLVDAAEQSQFVLIDIDTDWGRATYARLLRDGERPRSEIVLCSGDPGSGSDAERWLELPLSYPRVVTILRELEASFVVHDAAATDTLGALQDALTAWLDEPGDANAGTVVDTTVTHLSLGAASDGTAAPHHDEAHGGIWLDDQPRSGHDAVADAPKSVGDVADTLVWTSEIPFGLALEERNDTLPLLVPCDYEHIELPAPGAPTSARQVESAPVEDTQIATGDFEAFAFDDALIGAVESIHAEIPAVANEIGTTAAGPDTEVVPPIPGSTPEAGRQPASGDTIAAPAVGPHRILDTARAQIPAPVSTEGARSSGAADDFPGAREGTTPCAPSGGPDASSREEPAHHKSLKTAPIPLSTQARFDPSTRFLGLVESIIAQNCPMVITHDNFPPIEIYPDRDAFFYPFELGAFVAMYREPSTRFVLQPIGPGTPDDAGRLQQTKALWRLLFAAALLGGEGRWLAAINPHSHMRLVSLPNLLAVPYVHDFSQIVNFMLKQPAEPAQVAHATGVPLAVVVDFCNACYEVSMLELLPDPRPPETANFDGHVLREFNNQTVLNSLRRRLGADQTAGRSKGLLRLLLGALRRRPP